MDFNAFFKNLWFVIKPFHFNNFINDTGVIQYLRKGRRLQIMEEMVELSVISLELCRLLFDFAQRFEDTEYIPDNGGGY